MQNDVVRKHHFPVWRSPCVCLVLAAKPRSYRCPAAAAALQIGSLRRPPFPRRAASGCFRSCQGRSHSPQPDATPRQALVAVARVETCVCHWRGSGPFPAAPAHRHQRLSSSNAKRWKLLAWPSTPARASRSMTTSPGVISPCTRACVRVSSLALRSSIATTCMSCMQRICDVASAPACCERWRRQGSAPHSRFMCIALTYEHVPSTSRRDLTYLVRVTRTCFSCQRTI